MELTPREGQQASPVEGVTLWRLNRSVPRVPVLYEPCVAFVVQSHKRGFLGDRIFIYSPNSYLSARGDTARREHAAHQRRRWRGTGRPVSLLAGGASSGEEGSAEAAAFFRLPRVAFELAP
jgi:hypothetical protein